MQRTLARFAPAKINLFLEVAGPRPDGYHDIVTVMETVAAGDVVEAAHADELSVVTTRPDVPSGADNVAFKIIRAAEERLRRPLPARITIVKNIPPGSGLGAGSSDAVSALLLVLELHRIRPPREDVMAIAASVGSDTAFFERGGLALCTGRGEVVRALPERGVRHVVLVYPAGECSTAKVYGAVGPASNQARRSPSALTDALGRGSALAEPPDDALLFNRLAAAAERVYPDLAARRTRLGKIAGRTPHLSGSGGTFFFLCPSRREAVDLAVEIRSADPKLEVRETASYRGMRAVPDA